MDREPPAGRKRPSGFQIEAQRLVGLFGRWMSHELDRFFDLSLAGAQGRQVRISIGLLAFAVAAFCAHAFLRAQTRTGEGYPFDLAALSSAAFIIALRIILVMGIAYYVALNIAGNFLADIFEIKDVSIARRFIQSIASGTSDEVLHLRDGRILEADRNSPMVLIGGPGRVQVEFDTAALFERPDGIPHVVGPTRSTQDDPAGGAQTSSLGGFERLREPIVDLRDQYIGSLSGEPMMVVGRSLDGIPVSVADVRGIFSVRREAEDDAEASPQLPFSVRARDIEALIYKQSVPVLTFGGHASGQPGDWTNMMKELIRAALSEFMSQNRLADYLAGIGAQEFELSEFREDTILSRTLQVANEPRATSPIPGAARSRFHPRTELSAGFKKYSGEFSTRAQEHGLELHWIGVGTWKMPDESSGAVVNEKHLDAWRMNRENAQRSDPQALERVSEAAALEAKLRLIRETPIQSHERNRARYSDKDVLIESLLQDFWEQMGQALDLYYKGGAPSADLDGLEQAVLKVEELLRIRRVGHVLGGGTMSRVRPKPASVNDEEAPPAPSSRGEEEKYRRLLGRVDGNYRVAEAMIANEARRHAGLGREELITRIVQRLERHGT